MWFGWYYSCGAWHRLCEAADDAECSRLLSVAIASRGHNPWGPTNQHRRLTQGGYPRGLPPHPKGDGVRRDE